MGILRQKKGRWLIVVDARAVGCSLEGFRGGGSGLKGKGHQQEVRSNATIFFWPTWYTKYCNELNVRSQ